MALPGERLIIVATPDGVHEGETFDRLPPHMTVVRWFNLQEHRRGRLTDAMDRLLNEKSVFDKASAGRLAVFGTWNHPTLVRRIEGIETVKARDGLINPEQFALHALVNSLGTFDEADRFKDTFSPHMAQTKEFKLRRDEPVAFSSVSLIGTEGSHQEHHVIASFLLGRGNG